MVRNLRLQEFSQIDNVPVPEVPLDIYEEDPMVEPDEPSLIDLVSGKRNERINLCSLIATGKTSASRTLGTMSISTGNSSVSGALSLRKSLAAARFRSRKSVIMPIPMIRIDS